MMSQVQELFSTTIRKTIQVKVNAYQTWDAKGSYYIFQRKKPVGLDLCQYDYTMLHQISTKTPGYIHIISVRLARQTTIYEEITLVRSP